MTVIRKIRKSGNTFRTLTGDIEQIFSENLTAGYPDSWDMDTANERLVAGLRSVLDGKSFAVPEKTINTRLWPYKLADDNESAVYDIAMLVNITYHDSHTSSGTLFIQGALKDPDKNTFSGLRKDTLRKLHSLSPHAWVMLCDYDTIAGMAYPAMADYVIGDNPQGWSNWAAAANGVVIPSGLAIELGVKTTGLYKGAVPFAHQLCYRFLMGLDLDYGKIARDAASGARTDKGLAKYLMLLSVSIGGAEGDSEPDFDINRELYSPVVPL